MKTIWAPLRKAKSTVNPLLQASLNVLQLLRRSSAKRGLCLFTRTMQQILRTYARVLLADTRLYSEQKDPCRILRRLAVSQRESSVSGLNPALGLRIGDCS